MKLRYKTSILGLALSGLIFTGCGRPSNQALDPAVLSLFSSASSSSISMTNSSYVVADSDPTVTGCKIKVTSPIAPLSPGTVRPGQTISFELEGEDPAHIENAGFIEGLGNSIGDLPATHSIIAPDVTTKYMLSVFTVDGIRTRNNNCEIIINVSPATGVAAELPSCEIHATPAIVTYGAPLSLSWTSRNGVSAEISPTNAIGVIAPGDVTAGSWNYKSYYGNNFSMKVWNADGRWAQCSANIKQDVGHNAPPTADDDGRTINSSSSISATLIARDLENDSLTYSIKTPPTKGTVVITNALTGEFVYTPNSGASGTDGFTFTANDGQSDSNLATWRIHFKGRVLQVKAGALHTCALLESGQVRCWGNNELGQLGYGHLQRIGDDETPASVGYVDVGGTVKQIAAGGYHTCALLDSGAVRCWGSNNKGQLGYGHTQDIGDNETPATAGDVNVGGLVRELAVGYYHTCALLDSGQVRCWGRNFEGQLGYGHTQDIGDNETPAGAGYVNVGGSVKQLIANFLSTCALLDSGNVRCWGQNTGGQLGYNLLENIGDTETPASRGDINVGGPVKHIATSGNHTCATLASGALRCWGFNSNGQLGYGNRLTIGDNETPSNAGDVDVGAPVKLISAGGSHNCAILTSNNVRCWGWNLYGQLGYGHNRTIGAEETPAGAGLVVLGGDAIQLTSGWVHTCALLDSGQVRCWGLNQYGQLGYGNTQNIGDNETPASAGDVDL